MLEDNNLQVASTPAFNTSFTESLAAAYAGFNTATPVMQSDAPAVTPSFVNYADAPYRTTTPVPAFVKSSDIFTLDTDPFGERTEKWAKRTGQTVDSNYVAGLSVFGRTMSREQLAASDAGRRLLELEEKKRQGTKRDFFDAVTDFQWSDLPFLSLFATVGKSVSDAVTVSDTFKKLQNGDAVTDDELIKTRLYMAEQEYQANGTWGSTVGDIMRAAPGFMVDLLASGGLYAGARTVASKVAKRGIHLGMTRATKVAARELMEAAARQKIGAEGIEQATKDAIITGATATVQKPAAALAGKLAGLADDTVAKEELVDQVAKALVNKSNGLMAGNPLYKGLSDDALYSMARNRAEYEFRQLVARNTGNAVARSLTRSGQWAKSHISRGLLDFGTWGTDEATVAFTNHSKAGRALFDALGTFTLEAPIRGGLLMLPNVAVARPLAGQALGQDGRTVSSSQLGLQHAAYMTGNRELMAHADSTAMGINLLEYVSESAGRGFSSLMRAAGLGLQKAGARGLVAPTSRVIMDTGDLLPVDKSAVTIGGKMREYIQKVFGTREDYLKRVHGDELKAVTRAFNITDARETAALTSAIAHRDFSTLPTELASKLGVNAAGGSKSFDNFMTDLMRNAYEKETTDMAYKSYARFAVANFMARRHIGPETVMNLYQKMGYDGILGEMFEERYSDFAKGLLGLDDRKHHDFMSNLKEAVKGLYPGFDQLTAEAVGFAVPLVTRSAIMRLQASVGGGGKLQEIRERLDALDDALRLPLGERMTFGNYLRSYYEKMIDLQARVSALDQESSKERSAGNTEAVAGIQNEVDHLTTEIRRRQLRHKDFVNTVPNVLDKLASVEQEINAVQEKLNAARESGSAPAESRYTSVLRDLQREASTLRTQADQQNISLNGLATANAEAMIGVPILTADQYRAAEEQYNLLPLPTSDEATQMLDAQDSLTNYAAELAPLMWKASNPAGGNKWARYIGGKTLGLVGSLVTGDFSLAMTNPEQWVARDMGMSKRMCDALTQGFGEVWEQVRSERVARRLSTTYDEVTEEAARQFAPRARAIARANLLASQIRSFSRADMLDQALMYLAKSEAFGYQVDLENRRFVKFDGEKFDDSTAVTFDKFYEDNKSAVDSLRDDIAVATFDILTSRLSKSDDARQSLITAVRLPADSEVLGPAVYDLAMNMISRGEDIVRVQTLGQRPVEEDLMGSGLGTVNYDLVTYVTGKLSIGETPDDIAYSSLAHSLNLSYDGSEQGLQRRNEKINDICRLVAYSHDPNRFFFSKEIPIDEDAADRFMRSNKIRIEVVKKGDKYVAVKGVDERGLPVRIEHDMLDDFAQDGYVRETPKTILTQKQVVETDDMYLMLRQLNHLGAYKKAMEGVPNRDKHPVLREYTSEEIEAFIKEFPAYGREDVTGDQILAAIAEHTLRAEMALAQYATGVNGEPQVDEVPKGKTSRDVEDAWVRLYKEDRGYIAIGEKILRRAGVSNTNLLDQAMGYRVGEYVPRTKYRFVLSNGSRSLVSAHTFVPVDTRRPDDFIASMTNQILLDGYARNATLLSDALRDNLSTFMREVDAAIQIQINSPETDNDMRRELIRLQSLTMMADRTIVDADGTTRTVKGVGMTPDTFVQFASAFALFQDVRRGLAGLESSDYGKALAHMAPYVRQLSSYPSFVNTVDLVLGGNGMLAEFLRGKNDERMEAPRGIARLASVIMKDDEAFRHALKQALPGGMAPTRFLERCVESATAMAKNPIPAMKPKELRDQDKQELRDLATLGINSFSQYTAFFGRLADAFGLSEDQMPQFIAKVVEDSTELSQSNAEQTRRLAYNIARKEQKVVTAAVKLILATRELEALDKKIKTLAGAVVAKKRKGQDTSADQANLKRLQEQKALTEKALAEAKETKGISRTELENVRAQNEEAAKATDQPEKRAGEGAGDSGMPPVSRQNVVVDLETITATEGDTEIEDEIEDEDLNYTIRTAQTDYDQDLHEFFTRMVQDRNESADHVMTEESAKLGVNVVVRAAMAKVQTQLDSDNSPREISEADFLEVLDRLYPAMDPADRALMLVEYRNAEAFVLKHGGSWEKFGVNGTKWMFTEDDKEDETPSESAFNKTAVDEYNNDELGLFLDHSSRIAPETGRNFQAFVTNLRDLVRDGVELAKSGVLGDREKSAFEFLQRLLNPRAETRGTTYNERKALYDQFVAQELNDTKKVNEVVAVLLGGKNRPVLRRGAFLLSYLASLESAVRMHFLDLVSESTVSDMAHVTFNSAGQAVMEQMTKTDVTISVDMLRNVAATFVGVPSANLAEYARQLRERSAKIPTVDPGTANRLRKNRTDRTGASDKLAVLNGPSGAFPTVVSNIKVLGDVIGSVIGRENPLYSALTSSVITRYIGLRNVVGARKSKKSDSFPRVLEYIAEAVSPRTYTKGGMTTVKIDLIESLASVLETLAEVASNPMKGVTIDEAEPFLLAMFSTGNLQKAGMTQAPSTPMYTDAWNTLLGMYEDSQPITVRRAELDQQRDRGASSSVAIATPGVVPIISRFMDRRLEGFVQERLAALTSGSPNPEQAIAARWGAPLTEETLAQARQDVTWPDKWNTPIIAKNISKSYNAEEVLAACANAAVTGAGPVWVPVYAGDKNSAVMLQLPRALCPEFQVEEGQTALDAYLPFATTVCDEIGLGLLGDDTKRVALSSMTAAGVSTIGVREPLTQEEKDAGKPVFGEHRVHILYNFDLKDKCQKNNESFFGNTLVVGYAAERQRERAKTAGTATLKCHAVSTEGDHLAFLKALCISTTKERGEFLEGMAMRAASDYLRKELGDDGVHSTHTLTDKDSYKIGVAGSKNLVVVSTDTGGKTVESKLMDYVFNRIEAMGKAKTLDLSTLNMTTTDLDTLFGQVTILDKITGKSRSQYLSELLPAMRLKSVNLGNGKGPAVDLAYVDNNISYFSVANVAHDAHTKVNRTPRNHVVDAFTMARVQNAMKEVTNKEAATRVLDLISYWGLISGTLNSHPGALERMRKMASGIIANTRYGEHRDGQNNLEELAKNLWSQLRETNNLPLFSMDAPLVSAGAEIGKDGKVYYQTDSLMHRAMMVGSQVFTKTEREFYQTSRRLALCNVNIRQASFRYGWFLDREKFITTYKMDAGASDQDILLKMEEVFTELRSSSQEVRGKATPAARKEARGEVVAARTALMSCFIDHHGKSLGDQKTLMGKSYAETVSFEDLFVKGLTSGSARRFDRSAVQIDGDRVHNDATGKAHIFLGGTTFGFPRTPSYNGSMWLQTVRAGLPVTEIVHGEGETATYEVGKDAMVSADPFTNKILGCDHDGDKAKLYLYFSRGGDADFVDDACFTPFDDMNKEEFATSTDERRKCFDKCMQVGTQTPMFVKKYLDENGKVATAKPGDLDRPDSWYEMNEDFRYLYSNSFVQCLFDMSRDLECKPATDVRQQFADGPMSRETKANPLDTDEMLNEIIKEVGAPAVITKQRLLRDPEVAAKVSRMAMDASDARAKIVSLASALHVAWASGYFSDTVTARGKTRPGLVSGLEDPRDWIRFIYLIDGISNATFDDLKNQKCSRLGWTSDMMEVLITDCLLNRGAGRPVTTSAEMREVLYKYAEEVNKTRGSRYWMKNAVDVTNIKFGEGLRRIFGSKIEPGHFNPREYDPGVKTENIMSTFDLEWHEEKGSDGTTYTKLRRKPLSDIQRKHANLGQALAEAFEKAGEELQGTYGLSPEDCVLQLITCNTASHQSKIRLGYLGWIVKDTAGTAKPGEILTAVHSKEFDTTDPKVMKPLIAKVKEFLIWNEKFNQLNTATEFTRSINYPKVDPGNDNAVGTRDKLVKSYTDVTEGFENDEMAEVFARMHAATRLGYNIGYNISTVMARAITARSRIEAKDGAIDRLHSDTTRDSNTVRRFLDGLDRLGYDTGKYLPMWDKLGLQSNAQQIPYIIAVLQTREKDSPFFGALNAYDLCDKLANATGEARRLLVTEDKSKDPDVSLKYPGKGNVTYASWVVKEPLPTSKILDFRYGIEAVFDLMYRLASTSQNSVVSNAFSYFRMVEDTSYSSNSKTTAGQSANGLRRILLQFTGGTENFIARARTEIEAVKQGKLFSGSRDYHRFPRGTTVAKQFSLTVKNIDDMIAEALAQHEAIAKSRMSDREREALAAMTKDERIKRARAADVKIDEIYRYGQVAKAFVKALGQPLTPKMMFSDLLPIYTAITERTLGTPDPRSGSLFAVLGGYETLSRQQTLNDINARDVIDSMIPYNFAPVAAAPHPSQGVPPEFHRRVNPAYRHTVDIFSPGQPFRNALQLIGTPPRTGTDDTPGKKLGDMLTGNLPPPSSTPRARDPRVERLANAMRVHLPWADVKYDGGSSFVIHGQLRGNKGTGKRMVIAVNAQNTVETEEDVTRYANSYAYAASLTSTVDLGITAREFLDTLPLSVRKALVRKYGVGGYADNRIVWSLDGKTLANAIQLTLPEDQSKVGTAIYHEYFHSMMTAFESLDLFGAADYKAFKKAFGAAPEGSDWKFNQEKAAEAFRKWLLDREAPEAKDARTIFQKIYDFIRDIISAVLSGFRYEELGTADTLFSMVLSGVAHSSVDTILDASTTTLDAVEVSKKSKDITVRLRNTEDMAAAATAALQKTLNITNESCLGPRTAEPALAEPYQKAEETALTALGNPNVDIIRLRGALTALSSAGKDILRSQGTAVPPAKDPAPVLFSTGNVDPKGTEEHDIQATQVAVKLATIPSASANAFYKTGEMIAEAVRKGLVADGSWDVTLERIQKRYRDANRAILIGADALDKQVAKQAIRQVIGAVNPEMQIASEKIENSLVFQSLLVAEQTIHRSFVKQDAFAPLAQGYLHGGETEEGQEIKEHVTAYDIAGWVLASRAVSPHDLAEQALARIRALKGEALTRVAAAGEGASSASVSVFDKCITALETVSAACGDPSALVDWVAWKGSTTVNEILPSLVGGLKKPTVNNDGYLNDYELIDDLTQTKNPHSRTNHALYAQCLSDRDVQEALKTTITTVLQALSMNKYYRETGVLPGTFEDLEACRTFNALNIPDHLTAADWFNNQAIGNLAAGDSTGLIDYQNQSGFIGTNVDNWVAAHIRPAFGGTALRDMMMSETHEYEWLKSEITRVENRHAMLLGDNADAGAELLAVLDHQSEFEMRYGNVVHDKQRGRNSGETYKFDNLHKKTCGVRYTVDELRTVDLFKKSLSAYANRQTYMLTGVNRISFEHNLPDDMLDPNWYDPRTLLNRWNNAKPGDQFTRMEVACVRMLRQLHRDVLMDPTSENRWYLGLYQKFVRGACFAMDARRDAIQRAKDKFGAESPEVKALTESFNSDVLSDLESLGLVLAQRNNNGTLKQGVLVIATDDVDRMFRGSSAYEKLIEKGGRDPRWLRREALVGELMPVYRKAAEFVKKHAWISRGDAKYLNTFSTPLMHFSGSGVFMYDAVRVSRDAKKSRSASLPRYVDSYRRALQADTADQPLDAGSIGLMEIVSDIFRTREEGMELLELIKSGGFRAGSERSVKTGLVLEPDATGRDLSEVIYQRLLDLAWQEQVSDGKLTFNVRSMEEMIELYEEECGTAQNIATGGLGLNDETMFKRYGILPANMQLGHKVHTAIDQLTNAIMQRNTIVNMLFTPAADGAPVYLANPSEFVRDENGKSIPEGVWAPLARWWSEYYGGEDPQLRDKLAYDESKDGIDNARRIYSILSEMVKTNKGKLVSKSGGKVGDHRYTVLPEGESDLISINGWLVMDDEDLGEESSLLNKISGGEAMGYLRQVVQSGRVLGLGGAGVRQHLQCALSWSKSLSVSFSFFFPLATRFESPVGAVGAMATMFGNAKAGSRFLRKHPELMSRLQNMFVGKGWITKDFLGYSDIIEMMDSHDPFLAELHSWAAALGITISDRLVNPMEPTKSRVVEDIKQLKRIVKDTFNTETAAKFGNMMDTLFLRSGEKAFTYALNATKLCVVAQLAMRLRYEAKKRGKAFDPIRDLRKYSGYINAEVGGIDPAAYAWSTPRFRSIMNGLLFSWEWTRGAWEAGGGHAIEDLVLGGHTISKEERRFMIGRWIRMWGEVMIGVPLMMQIVCKALGLALGHDDDEDRWFAWDNESKVGSSAFDITPLLRAIEKADDTHLGGVVKKLKEDGGPAAALLGTGVGLVAGAIGSRGVLGRLMTGGLGGLLGAGAGAMAPSLLPMYTGGDPANQTTQNRRYYMHFGKQGWEFFRWFEAPGQQFLTKLSMPVQRLLEGFFGRNLSYMEKELPWSDKGPLERWMPVPDSATVNCLKAFLPFSVNGLSQFGDAGFLPVVGPVSMGASQTAIQDKLVTAITAWANNDRRGYKYGMSRKDKNAKYTTGYVADILKDAERNGLDAKDMFDKALGQVMTRVYSRLFRALPTDPSRDFDVKEVERCARILNRLGAKKQSVVQSIKKRLERQGRDWDTVLTPEQRAMYLEVIGKALRHPFDYSQTPVRDEY